MNQKLKKVLLDVQKPARYIGGEYHEVIKNKDEVDFNVAFCFPDTYEIGMSYLGLKILTGVLNERCRGYGAREYLLHGLIWNRK